MKTGRTTYRDDILEKMHREGRESLTREEWRTLLDQARFSVGACYGWFDRRPWAGEEDSIWIASRPVIE